jgi:hypothetical protein
MKTKYILFILFVFIFKHISIPSQRFSEDYRAIYQITKAIEPSPVGLSKTIFFLRPNNNIQKDSMTIIIKALLKNKVDSINHFGKMVIKECNFSNDEHPIYLFSCGIIIKYLLFKNYYSLDIYLDTIEEIIGISSLKWQSGFVEPAKTNAIYAKKVKNLFLNQYKNAEYIGSSKTKCKIDDNHIIFNNGLKQFWKWFKHYEEYLYDYEKDKERIDKNITRKLRLIDYNLSFEICQIKENKREIIIIGSEYLKERILKSVPKLHLWKVTFENKYNKYP